MGMRRAGVVALVLAVLAACGGRGEGREEKVDHPLDRALRLNHLQVLGTHNSYHVAPLPGPDLTPARDITQAPLAVQLDRQGMRQIELDVHVGRRGGLAVFHVPGDEGTTCPTFVQCLREVKGWSEANSGHLPVFVLVEPKHQPGALVDPLAVEEEVRSVFRPGQLLTPDDVQGDAPSLGQAVRERGWPVLGATRNKVMVVLNDELATRSAYTADETSLRGRAMFVYSDPSSALAAFMSVPDARAGGPQIDALVRTGYIVRTRADDGGIEARANDTSRAVAALASGAQVVSTDFPVPAPSGYVVTAPGTPARCNPVTAPPQVPCAPGDLERLP